MEEEASVWKRPETTHPHKARHLPRAEGEVPSELPAPSLDGAFTVAGARDREVS